MMTDYEFKTPIPIKMKKRQVKANSKMIEADDALNQLLNSDVSQ